MADAARPFVAVIGGFFNMDPAKKDAAKAYARELGAALAKAGFGLVVYFSEEDSLEPHVVKGYVSALPTDPPNPCIRVRYPESQKNTVRFAEQQTRPALFDPKLMPLDDWEAPFYRSLVEPGGADAVVLMAGNRAVLTAGQIVIARPLPTLALNNFDGSASVIWRELSRATTGYPDATNLQPLTLVEWLNKQVEARTRELRLVAERAAEYERLATSKLPTALTAVAAASFVGLLILGVSRVAFVEAHYAMLIFLGLVVAGATGALSRTLLWGRTNLVSTSLLLGGLAGLLVGMAYLIPQLIGAPGVFGNGTEVKPESKIQFISALITGFSAGIGFDTIFNRLKDRATELAIKAPDR